MNPYRLIPAALLAGTVLSACGSGSSNASPNPIDVQAARACQAFVSFADHKVSGQQLINAATPLIAGSAQAQANNQPAPKWSDLGGNLISLASLGAGESSAQFATDANKAVSECGSIPPDAKTAGGFTK